MRGQGHQIFADELRRFAARTDDRRTEAVAERATEPLRLAVRGRRGVGCSTVACALDRAGSSLGITVAPPERTGDRGDQPAELVVYVIAEAIKPEDSDALEAIAATRQPVVAVLNKADLVGTLSGDGPIAAAHARCKRFSALVGTPVEPLIGLLAVAALDDPDRRPDPDLWAALRVLAAHREGPTCVDGSFDGFLAAQLPVPTEIRVRLLDTFDLFGIALGVAGFRAATSAGELAGTAEQVRVLLRRVSGIDAVLDRICAICSQLWYRRVLVAVAELEALAVSRDRVGEQVAEFLSSDDSVLARMAVAIDVVRASGLAAGSDPEPEPAPSDGPAAHLSRAVRWQRYRLHTSAGRLDSTSEVGRACAADIARGSLRLWSDAGAVPPGASEASR
ncbi:hypothetical protein [Mycobacterium spongiae]|uniref:Uncharacterized protein n=1 Tax=Mycobacterium spongiae TaxID=886343 RepID=A0A975JUM3_9MYCO|nr:hypothetical protein [Mycobacterium spongiae]QUR65961.1 hypothetical protein F6B93_01695 [Mycobacterium spongiae]